MSAAASAPGGTGDPADATLNIYGQKQQPEETPEFLSKSHADLLDELEKRADGNKGWLKAKELCPDLVGEEHRLMFLRCELFNAEVRTEFLVAARWSRVCCGLLSHYFRNAVAALLSAGSNSYLQILE